MTDHDLLKFAASAAGGLLYVADMDAWIECDEAGARGSWWDPLTHDVDAFRLAVKLSMVVDTDYNGGVVAGNATVAFAAPEYGYQEGRGEKDLCAATRRAIVKVAAEMGQKANHPAWCQDCTPDNCSGCAATRRAIVKVAAEMGQKANNPAWCQDCTPDNCSGCCTASS